MKLSKLFTFFSAALNYVVISISSHILEHLIQLDVGLTVKWSAVDKWSVCSTKYIATVIISLWTWLFIPPPPLLTALVIGGPQLFITFFLLVTSLETAAFCPASLSPPPSSHHLCPLPLSLLFSFSPSAHFVLCVAFFWGMYFGFIPPGSLRYQRAVSHLWKMSIGRLCRANIRAVISQNTVPVR